MKYQVSVRHMRFADRGYNLISNILISLSGLHGLRGVVNSTALDTVAGDYDEQQFKANGSRRGSGTTDNGSMIGIPTGVDVLENVIEGEVAK